MKSSLGNYLPHTEFDKLCTILVRNLPSRVDGKYPYFCCELFFVVLLRHGCVVVSVVVNYRTRVYS
jgi:hypothetical protein